MPIGTAVHERTFALCESLNYREWSGYYAVSAYEAHHEHEYNAIRNAAALIDVSPLFKYLVTGRMPRGSSTGSITRDVSKIARRPGLLHAVVRRARQGHRRRDGVAAGGADVPLDRRGPEPALVPAERRRARRRDRGRFRGARRACATGADVGDAAARRARGRYRQPEVLPGHAAARSPACRSTSRAPAIRAISATRSGCPPTERVAVWDALMAGGTPFDIKPAGMLALDVARVEAGLLLIDVDFFGSKKALIETQKYTPFEMGLGRLVSLDKGRFIGQARCATSSARGPRGRSSDSRSTGRRSSASTSARPCAAGRRRGVARRRPGLPRRPAGRQGDVDHVVAGAEEDDRAGDRRAALVCRGYSAADGDHGRGRPALGARDRREDALFQPREENGDSSRLTPVHHRTAWAPVPGLYPFAPVGVRFGDGLRESAAERCPSRDTRSSSGRRLPVSSAQPERHGASRLRIRTSRCRRRHAGCRFHEPHSGAGVHSRPCSIVCGTVTPRH